MEVPQKHIMTVTIFYNCHQVLIISFPKVQVCWRNQLFSKRFCLPISNMTLLISLLFYIWSLVAHLKMTLFDFDLWVLFSRNFQEVYDYLFCSMPALRKIQWRDCVLSARCSASSMLNFSVLLKADNSRLLASLFVSFQMAFSFLDTDTVWASSNL